MEKQKLIGKSGVYAILLDDVVRYIGSSVNMESRKSNHLARLRQDKHCNKKLQELFNKYGEGKFRFYCLDYCEKESLYELERLHMLVHEDTITNNDRVISLNKHVRTEKEKKEISKKFSKIMRGENNPNAKITEAQARQIIKMKNDNVKHELIANFFGVSCSQISKIGKERWKHLA